MNPEITNEILEELASSFERVEAQSGAVVQFLKAKGLASDEDLAPYIAQAASASNVRWRALRVRFSRLLLELEKSSEHAEKATAKKEPETAPSNQKVQTGAEGEHSTAPADAKARDRGNEPSGPWAASGNKDAVRENSSSVDHKSSSATDRQKAQPAPDKKPQPESREQSAAQQTPAKPGQNSENSSSSKADGGDIGGQAASKNQAETSERESRKTA